VFERRLRLLQDRDGLHQHRQALFSPDDLSGGTQSVPDGPRHAERSSEREPALGELVREGTAA